MLLFGTIAIVIVAGVIALWAARCTRTRKSPRAQLSQSLGVPEGSPLVVERDGRAFTAKYTPASKNTPPFVRVTTPVDEATKANVFGEGRGFVDTRPYIVMRRETGMDRFGKRHGLNREITVGDAAFDAAVYIETNSAEANVQRTMADARLRKAVRDLLDTTGVRHVVLGPKGLYTKRAVKSGQGPGDGIDQTMALLAAIAATLPLFKTGQADKPRWLFETIVVIFALVTIICLAVLSVPAPLGSTAKLVGLGGGVAISALILLGASKLLSGRSDSLRRIGTLFIATLVILPWGSYELLCWANRELDTSPAVGHPTRIVRTWTTKPKSRTYYHIEVATWRPGEAVVSLDVSSAFAEKAKTGRGIVVTTHAGKLGWEWVESFRLTP